MEGHDIQKLAVTAKDSVIVRGGYPTPYSSPNGGEYFDDTLQRQCHFSTSDLRGLIRKMILDICEIRNMSKNIMFYLLSLSLRTSFTNYTTETLFRS